MERRCCALPPPQRSRALWKVTVHLQSPFARTQAPPGPHLFPEAQSRSSGRPWARLLLALALAPPELLHLCPYLPFRRLRNSGTGCTASVLIGRSPSSDLSLMEPFEPPQTPLDHPRTCQRHGSPGTLGGFFGVPGSCPAALTEADSPSGHALGSPGWRRPASRALLTEIAQRMCSGGTGSCRVQILWGGIRRRMDSLAARACEVCLWCSGRNPSWARTARDSYAPDAHTASAGEGRGVTGVRLG